MSLIKLFVLSLLISSCYATFAQEQKEISKPAAVYSIPFQLTAYNNMSVQAILNKKDTVHLMFHTAASAVTLIEAATQKLNSLHFEGTDTVKSWGGANNFSRFSRNNTLQIGQLEWTGVPIGENKNTGQNTDGKFGTDLLQNKVIEIDFEKGFIKVLTALPSNTRKYEKLKLTVENDMMFLEAECLIGKQSFKNKFLIHSGYAGAILFDDKFASETNIGENLPIISTKELKDSYGNVLKTQKAILPTLKIGTTTLSDVPAGFFQGALGRQKMSIIGGDILKRFNIIIDAQHEYVYLKPNKLATLKYTDI